MCSHEHPFVKINRPEQGILYQSHVLANQIKQQLEEQRPEISFSKKPPTIVHEQQNKQAQKIERISFDQIKLKQMEEDKLKSQQIQKEKEEIEKINQQQAIKSMAR